MRKEGNPLLSKFYSILSAISYGPGGHKVATIVSGVLMCVLAVVSIGLIVVVLLQKSNPDDVSAITGGSSDTYYNKNKEMSPEKKLKIATIVLSCIMVVSAIVFFIIAPSAS